MNSRDRDYYNRCWFKWAEWEFLDRGAVPGLFPQSWPETVRETAYKPRYGVKRQKLRGSKGQAISSLYRPLAAQPSSTRNRPSSRPLLHRLDRTSEKIRGIVIVQPDHVKGVIICLWHRRNNFAEIKQIMGLTSRQIGDIKHRLFLDSAKVL